MLLLNDLCSLPFFQHALYACVLLSIICGIVGSYVVLKKLSFLSGSISHSAFGGIGMALYYGFNPLLGALGFGVLTAILIEWIRQHFQQERHVLIALVWSLGMSIGIIFLNLYKGFAPDLNAFLFGNILLCGLDDIVIMACFSVLILALNVLYFRSLQAISFDEEYARVINLPVKTLNFLLSIFIGISTILLIKAVGITLAIALFILPAAIGKNLSYSLKKIQYIAIFFTLISTFIGVFLSYLYNQPSGPVIVLTLSFFYLLSTFIKKTLRLF